MSKLPEEKTTTVHDYFTPARIALREEIKNHPELCEYIFATGITSWDDILGLVASYLGIELDGMFLPEELEAMNVEYRVKLELHRAEDAKLLPNHKSAKELH